MNTRPGAYEIPAYRLGLHFGRKTTQGGNNTVKKILAVLTMLVMLAPVTAMANGPKGGGEGGRGGHGSHGGHGGHGGSSGASVSAPAAAVGASVDGGAYGGLVTTNGEAYGKDREQVHADARSCDAFGDITVISKQNGSFTYGGLEFQMPTFVQCMKGKGYALSSAGRNELTNFGARD